MTAFQAKIGSVTVNVELGNMTAKKADAYIVPQFNSSASWGGVGGAVARAGASGGLQDYQDYLDKSGTQPFGQVVVTPAHGGNAKTLLHVVSVASEKENEFETVRTSIYNTLKTAEKEGIKTIGAPLLGTGIIGELTNEQSAKAMLSAIKSYAEEGGKPLEISFIIFDRNADAQQAFTAFRSVIETGAYKNVENEVGGREIDLVRWFNEMSSDAAENEAFGREKAKKFSTDRTIRAMKPASFGKK